MADEERDKIEWTIVGALFWVENSREAAERIMDRLGTLFAKEPWLVNALLPIGHRVGTWQHASDIEEGWILMPLSAPSGPEKEKTDG